MKNIQKKLVLTGAEAAAEVMRQVNPDVVAAYPITPQTPIVEKFAEYVADGKVDTEMIPVESEHSALSAVVGASSAGVRAMTATSSAGLALMFEITGVASGLRLPIVMHVVNRALSAPINIHCDHSDSMACRDSGWVQIFSENPQEVYDNSLVAQKIAEDADVKLPVMVMQDGFITSHTASNLEVLEDSVAQKFIGKFKSWVNLLDIKNPITVGPLQLTDSYFEDAIKREQGMGNAYDSFKKHSKFLAKIIGRSFDVVEFYTGKDTKNAKVDYIIVALNSTAGAAKDVVDEMRARGENVALLKIRLFRPFPYLEVAKALSGAKRVAVLDRSFSYGAYGPVASEVKNALHNIKNSPEVFGYTYGLGGREITQSQIAKVFDDLKKGKVTNEYPGKK